VESDDDTVDDAMPMGVGGTADRADITINQRVARLIPATAARCRELRRPVGDDRPPDGPGSTSAGDGRVVVGAAEKLGLLATSSRLPV
jgi:hypothetical protein